MLGVVAWLVLGAAAVRTQRQYVPRVRGLRAFLEARAGMAPEAMAMHAPHAWDAIEMDVPDVTDRATLRTLAHMATQAYDKGTKPIADAPAWHWSSSFGWEEEGLRGHIFATQDNHTVVVALKGTSASFLPGGSTGQRDKDNDNLLFSCCCGRVTPAWTPVCECYDGERRCDPSCIGRALIERSLYYPAATDMYNNISYMYPNSQIWMTGHSLGGVMASYLGMTFGVPAVAFESPGDRLGASRLHLPLPPPTWSDPDAFALAPVTHVYHTADALATGQCQGPSSICWHTGYAMETRCHAGQSVVYDTVRYLGWSVGVLSHRISHVVSELLSEDWDRRAARGGRVPKDTTLGAVPTPTRESLCTDCSGWQLS